MIYKVEKLCYILYFYGHTLRLRRSLSMFLLFIINLFHFTGRNIGAYKV